MDIEQCKIIVVLASPSVKMVFHTFQYSIIVNLMCFPKNHRVSDNNNKAGIYKHSNDYSVIKFLITKFFLCLQRNALK